MEFGAGFVVLCVALLIVGVALGASWRRGGEIGKPGDVGVVSSFTLNKVHFELQGATGKGAANVTATIRALKGHAVLPIGWWKDDDASGPLSAHCRSVFRGLMAATRFDDFAMARSLVAEAGLAEMRARLEPLGIEVLSFDMGYLVSLPERVETQTDVDARLAREAAHLEATSVAETKRSAAHYKALIEAMGGADNFIRLRRVDRWDGHNAKRGA